MNTKITINRIFGVLMLLSFLIFGRNSFAQIAGGPFTIGSDLANDYQTIQEAVDSLESQGVSGHVVFNLVDAVYNEQIWIDVIPGASAANTVTFQSASQNPDECMIYYGASTSTYNHVIRLNECDYVTLQYLQVVNTTPSSSYTRVIFLNGAEAIGNKILYNTLVGQSGNLSSTSQAVIYMYDDYVSYTEIIGNNIASGSYPIYMDGYYTYSTGCKINYNTCNSYRGVFLKLLDKVEFIGNEINSNYGDGLGLTSCREDIKIMYNKINATYSSTHSGIYATTTDGSFAFRGLFANNVIYVNGTSNSVCYGIYFNETDYQYVYHNTIYLAETQFGGPAFYANNGSEIVIKNNMFRCANSYPIKSNNGTNISQIDYNNYYTNGSFIASWGGSNINDLTALQAANGMDASSTEYYPYFTSSPDEMIPSIHWLDNTGTDLTGTIAYDFDSVARTATPDVGAYEFTVDNTMKFNGDLTIIPGGGGTFTSFTKAVDSLRRQGIDGPVTVSAADGIYSETIYLRTIPGASATNTVTFTSASDDSTAVTVENSGTSGANYTVNVNGARYITIKKMTLTNTGADYAIVVNMNGYAHHISIESCILNGSGNAENTDNRTIIYCNDDQTDFLTIRNNSFNSGSRAMRIDGIDGDLVKNTVIENNTMSDHQYEIFLIYATNFEILNNVVTDFTLTGFEIELCASPFIVANNELSSSLANGSGMYFYECTGSGSGGQVYNNFVHMENNIDRIEGIKLRNSTYMRFYYNSINIVSTRNDSKAFYFYEYYGPGNNNNILKNNSFYVDGAGYAFYNERADAFSESDYNNFYTNGSNLVRWVTTDYESLESYSVATEFDANSINYNPAYISESDLHTDSYWLDGGGTPITGITTDIDGETRDAVNPDIGADEYITSSFPLEGEYTIGSGGDYETINDAVDDLILKGMLDSVVFNILTGTYNEKVQIPQIGGVDASKRIYFQSQTGNPDDVIITYIPSGTADNYVFLLDGADYVTIKNLSLNTGGAWYARMIVFQGNAENNEIIGNKFQGRSATGTGTEAAIICTNNSPLINNTLIQDNIISNGSYGIYLLHNNSSYGNNIKIINNTINTYYMGMYLQYMQAPEISSNYVTYNVNNGYGINLYNCSSAASKGLKIYDNQIYAGVSNNYGSLYLRYCDANITYPGLIYNNVLRVGQTGTDRHIGIHINESDYIQLFHNTVNISNYEMDDFAFYSYNSFNLTLKNNNFAVCGSSAQNYGSKGYAVYVNGGSVAASDNNNFYSSGRYVARWVDSWYRELEDLQVATAMDQNSVSVYPAFLGENDLHSNSSWIDNEGTYLTDIPEDIEGNIRNASTPSIGAYEFVSDQEPIIGGSYTVGLGGDFPTIDSLETGLMELGISGPVAFNFKTGFYLNTNLFLRDVPGASEMNNIVLQSETGDPENVAFTYSQTVSSNYMIFLNGTDYITLMNMKFTAGGDGYAHIIKMNGNVHDVNIIGNSFNGPTKNSDDPDMACIYSEYENFIDNLLVEGNSFSNNSYGVQINGDDENSNNSIVVQNNEFVGQFRAVYLYYILGPVIQNNIIDGFSHVGVYLTYCDEDLMVVGNKITTEYDNVSGIYIHYSDGTVAEQGLISNNFVRCDGTGSNAFGINTYYSTYQRIYYNSVNITGSNYGGTACYLYGGSDLAVLNNIFSHKLGYAYYLSSTAVVSVSDFNNIYSEHATRVARVNYSDYASLSAFQTGTSLDPNSQEFEPFFLTNTDLHLYNNDLMGLAVPLGDVLLDIDGEVRDASTPDIGADELICEAATLDIPALTVCQFETVDPQNNSSGYIVGTQFLWDFNNSLPYEDTTYTFDTAFSYAYQTAGYYTAKLIAIQPGGCEDEITFNVTVNAKPDPPVVEDTVLGCYSHVMPPLVAEGTDILWYNNTDLDISHLVFTGDSLATGQTGMGNYTYYATQTVLGCQSDYEESTLAIRETPDPPIAESLTICFGDDIPTLSAAGNLIVWYADEDLTEVLFSASEYIPVVDTAGTYYFYVTQNNGECESFPTEVELDVLPTPNIVENITNIDCQGTDFGTIGLTIENGTFPYYFAWSNGEISQDVTNLGVGEYFVVVEDANGCVATDTFNITEPEAIVLELITNDSECAVSNGIATVTASGGLPPYEYHWSNGFDDVVNDSLASGIYIVTVSDNNGCSEIGVATINDLGAPVIAVNAVLDVSCYGGSDGQISLTVTGGASPYEFEWSNGETTDDVNELAAGPYEFQVTDTLGCLAVESFVITEPQPINIIMSTFESSCGQSTGSAIANVLGGTPPFDYDWSTGSTNPETISGLDLGVYGLTVTDDKLCTASKLFTINEVGAPSVVVDSIVEGGCGESNGAIYISVYGVADEYFYLWSNDSTTEDITGVNAGEYDVVVSDTSGCSAAAVAVIESDQPAINPLCMVSVDTGTFYNEIIWQKEYTEGVSHYNVYKESTQSDNYFLIGSVPVAEESIFIDSLSNSMQRSWRYKLSVVDSCGVESELSEEHKTMHLTVGVGVGGNVNLIWDHYEGVDFDTYYIQRYTETGGWVLYDSIQDNLTSYTDPADSIPLGEELWYFIELRHPYGCEIAKATNRDDIRSNSGSTGAATASSAKAFETYTFNEAIATGAISTGSHTVDITVESGTDVTNLVAIFTVSDFATAKINGVLQVSGTTANDFTNPVVYTIIAEDGSPQDWTVTVDGGQSSENDFLTYAFAESIGSSTIDTENHTVASVVATGTDVTNLVATFTSSEGSTVKVNDVVQESGVTANDFTNPVAYTITAEDGTEQFWIVSVTVGGEQSSENDFLTYSFAESVGTATINTTNHTVSNIVEVGTDVTNLVATFTSSEGSTVEVSDVVQESGVTTNDFTDPVTYVITAEDGTEQNWIVTVTIEGEQSSANDFLTYSFAESTGESIINVENHTVTNEVETGTDVTTLIATFTSSPQSTVKIGEIAQESGVTANDFTNSVTYTITAEDGTEQTWTVTVTVEVEQNSGTDFTSYLFAESSELSEIDAEGHTIVAKVAAATDVTGLAAIFALSEGATAYISGVEQVSAVTTNNFTNLVIYNVVAEDGTEQLWIVDVIETGIANVAGNEQFKLYPNPNNGLFTLEVDIPEINELTYYIFSMEGKVMETDELQINHTSQFDFDLSKYDSGIYYIKLVSDKGTYNHKIMIK
ncbi:T9SS type A sorting domain-containing protein [Bacteroidota bacterium]